MKTQECAEQALDAVFRPGQGCYAVKTLPLRPSGSFSTAAATIRKECLTGGFSLDFAAFTGIC